MKKCDLCDAEGRDDDFQALYQTYQIPGVAQLCPSCARWANETKSRLVLEVATHLKNEIRAKKEKYEHPRKLTWRETLLAWLNRVLK